MKIGLIQGAFEILNAGHCQVFRDCRNQCDYLIVALNTNELLKSYKKRDAVLPWEEKRLILESIRWVDKVIPAPSFSPLALLEKHNVDVYCMSHEWESTKVEEITFMKSKGGSVHFTTDYPIVRTSEIKRRLLEEAKGQG